MDNPPTSEQRVYDVQLRMMVEDFDRVQSFMKGIGKNYFPIPVGKETTRLRGTIIPINLTAGELAIYCALKSETDPVDIFSDKYPLFLSEQLDIEPDGGARIIVKDYLYASGVLGEFFGMTRSKLPELIGQSDINNNFFHLFLATAAPKEDKKKPSRHLAALCTAIGLGRYVVVSSASVKGTDETVSASYFDPYQQKDVSAQFSRIGTGRTLMLGHRGLEREAYLERIPINADEENISRYKIRTVQYDDLVQGTVTLNIGIRENLFGYSPMNKMIVHKSTRWVDPAELSVSLDDIVGNMAIESFEGV